MCECGCKKAQGIENEEEHNPLLKALKDGRKHHR